MDLVGIDVSAEHLTIVQSREGKRKRWECRNDRSSHEKLCRRLTRGGSKVRVVMESTGMYGLGLAHALHETEGIEVMVASPWAVRKFAEASCQRSKTDEVDAGVLVEYAQRMPFVAWQPPEQEAVALRLIVRRIGKRKQDKRREQNRLHAMKAGGYLDLLGDEIAGDIEHLDASIKRLMQKALRLVKSSATLSRRYRLLLSVPGIASLSAIQILGELAILPRDMTPRQWVAHAGLDPRHVQSGSSVRVPSRISRQGNPHLRAALYMPALVAIRHDEHVRTFYEQLIARGKEKMQAIVAVMRKLLHSIYGIFKADQQWNGPKFRSIAA